MKNGKTLQELATEIQRQQDAKRDFLVQANQMNAYVHNGRMELGFDNGSELITAPLTNNGHIQLGQFCGIPKPYYDAMLSHPELLTTNVKHWLERSKERRTVRTLDGQIRAMLSDKYRRLDNYDLAMNVLPLLHDANATVESCELTDKKLYIKAITSKVQREVKVGDVCQAGILISNSETGHGSLSVKPLVYRLVCRNGAIADDYAMKKYHVGRVAEEHIIEFSNETLRADDKAFWLKVRDLVKFSLDEVTFDKIIASMKDSTVKHIENPTKALELVTKKFSLTKDESENVLAHLIQGGDLTSWGLGNAVTRMAQDVESYDRSTELESIGFTVMQHAWN